MNLDDSTAITWLRPPDFLSVPLGYVCFAESWNFLLHAVAIN